jgi:hypothetical protein
MTTTNTTRAGLRIAADFTLGLALFALVAGSISLGHAQAHAGPTDPASWMTTVANVGALGDGTRAAQWHPLSREWALGLLALTFGAITALNMSVARHLRSIAVASKTVTHTEH